MTCKMVIEGRGGHVTIDMSSGAVCACDRGNMTCKMVIDRQHGHVTIDMS